MDILRLKAEVAAFDEAASWKLVDTISKLDDSILECAVDALDLSVLDKDTGSDYKTIPVPEKIKLNGFSEKVQRIIGRSLCFSRSIGRFIVGRSRTQSDFAVSLRTYFCQLYSNLRNEGFLQDDLFIAMRDYIADSLGDEKEAAAATAILVHLFLICDVFEKSGEAAERRLKKEATSATSS